MDEVAQINCVFNNQDSLYSAYMPFVKGGGLFVRTNNHYQLGNIVSLSVKVMDEDELYVLDGKVVWITPKDAQGNKLSGIGVQLLSENNRFLCNKIETYLAGMLQSHQLTDTM